MIISVPIFLRSLSRSAELLFAVMCIIILVRSSSIKNKYIHIWKGTCGYEEDSGDHQAEY